jgi:DNA-binding Xre family transcriptional regulator
MVLQKYVELKKIKKHKAMCERIGMKPDTFSAILRGKYGDVKKDNVLRICVGLELSVSEAEELLNSAGFMLSNAVMTDVVIKACLWDRQYNVVVINSELYENDAPMLFKDYKISYDVM